MQHSAIIRSEVSEVAFGLYTDVEIRRLSCCKVTSPVAFDALGNTLTGYVDLIIVTCVHLLY
jgi:hypothetical protein